MKLELPPSYRTARLLLMVAITLAIWAAAYAVIDSSVPERVRSAVTGIGDWARSAWEDS